MANFFKNLKPKADLSKHGFDMSQRHVFSLSAGMVLPALNLPCVPGDYHEISVANLLRAMPMQTAAFARCKQVVDFFFVPYVQLWRNWPSFINQRYDPTSSNQTGLPVNTPVFDLGETLSTIVQDNEVDGLVDVNGFSRLQGALRLLDLLGYGNYYSVYNLTDTAEPPSASSINGDINTEADSQLLLRSLTGTYVNPWPILAYNKIWSDYYRNPYWDSTILPRMFNVDVYSGINFESSVINVRDAADMFELKYRSWKKDYFTSLLPDSQFGGVSIASLYKDFSLFISPSPQTNTQVLSASTSTSQVGLRKQDGSSFQSVTFNTDGGVSVLELRKAEALQAWREKTIRAGYRSDDLSMAHFGVHPQFEEDSHPVFLGSMDKPIVIDDVQATAQTEAAVNGQLGDLGGKGISVASDGNVVKFKCSDFGVIMAMMYIVPETEYNSFGLDKDKTLIEPFDYYTSEFQNLGLEAVTAKELNVFSTIERTQNFVVGYAPRYYFYKSAYDKVHGEFAHEHTSANSQWRGAFRHWVAPLDRFQDCDMQGEYLPGMADPYNQYITPSVLDSLFYARYDGRAITDQFVCDMHFGIRSSRPMSVLGLPQF